MDCSNDDHFLVGGDHEGQFDSILGIVPSQRYVCGPTMIVHLT